MTDTQDNPENNTSPANESEPAPKTTKKTTKKKTTKKAASKKTTKKKTSKRAAKKTAKKTSRAKAESESESQEQDAPILEPVVEEALGDPEPEDHSEPEPESESDSDSEPQDEDRPSARRSRSKKTTKKTASKKTTKKTTKKSASTKSKAEKPASQAEMIINYVPGEECRIAMLEDGKLEELMVEPTDRVSRVGNIYVGKVMNIEPSIQAVFVDFGSEENGFLHISDLHPQYFASGEDKTERVGKKTPRKSRPPVQDCIKRGQEIIVQILKEGVGTKGPTLTSYLSIPGRFLVMMPGMDKVGVSRKEEDEDKRKAAKQILSQLDLPDGFGFILRTAGFDRNKAELKRDLSYLGRLWKDMETRRKGGNKPRLLYTESDLLVRSIRDLLTSEVSRVVIDSEPALRRVARFIKIAAPRSGAKLSHYTGTKPIFHAFGIEPQINEIHAREVMLPSGGRLVIDQTEALVAIDVNSGKSRAARDAETNAFKTNMEAVDAICRQLRLRDLGGLVVNDMIDMRFHSHRKEVEARFNERLKRDRAKSSTAPISPFGLLEMTRQRMRGSMESQHFADCPMCHGRGLVKRPDSVASTALRDLAALLDHEKVFRAELVVNPRVASALLSTRRSSLTRIELVSGKTLDVRVSESLPIDRVSFYAYEESGADISIEKLKPAKGKKAEPSVVEWRDENSPDGSWAMDPLDEIDETTVQKLAEEIARKADQAEHVELPVEGDIDADGEPFKKKRRRRRGGRGKGRSEEVADSNDSSDSSGSSERQDSDDAAQRDTDQSADSEPIELDENGEPIKKKRRRRRRRGRGRSSEGDNGQSSEADHDSSPKSDSSLAAEESADATPESSADQGSEDSSTEPKPRPRRRPRRRPTRDGQAGGTSNNDAPEQAESESASDKPETDRVTEPKPQAKTRRRSRSKKPVAENSEAGSTTETSSRSSSRKSSASKPTAKPAAKSTQESEKPKPKRGLYSNSRRVLSASELAKLGLE
jgi:ribonuclease E